MYHLYYSPGSFWAFFKHPNQRISNYEKRVNFIANNLFNNVLITCSYLPMLYGLISRK